jgi:hypothetical protein
MKDYASVMTGRGDVNWTEVIRSRDKGRTGE